MNKSILIIAFAAVFAVACAKGDAGTGGVDAAYVAEIEAGHVGRLERLRAADGYLNLAGLFWLSDITSRFGSADDNDLVFPPAAAAHIGEFEMVDDGVLMTVFPGGDVQHDGEPVESILMHDDTTEMPVTVSSGSLAWVVISRAGMIGVRLRDFNHPALDALPPIPHFDIDADWRVEGVLKLFDEPRIMNVGTVIEGLGYNPESPGVVAFEIDGESYELEAYSSGERLFFVFGDRTSGRDTYGAGRFVYAARPGEDGKTVLDFNKAYNPPCAFTPHATCPLPPLGNILSVAVESGERAYHAE